MSRLNFAVILAAVLGVNACSTWDKLNRTEKGAVIGGGTGALIGSEVGDGAGGALIGGAAGAVGGGLVGRELDDDRRRGRYRY